MVYCDRNEKILEWGSEEFFVPYRSPLDGKMHRYFPDFYVKVKHQKELKNGWLKLNPNHNVDPLKCPHEKLRNISMKFVLGLLMMQSGKMQLSIVKIEIWNLLS